MVKFGKDLVIEDNVSIDVKHLEIGDRTIIRSGSRIEGYSVVLGTECYMDNNAYIGGGSCFDKDAYMIAGDWLHMGANSHINIARGVKIGNEVGIGIDTKIFTHGAYLSVIDGFPAQWGPVNIGNNVWLPNAWVNPNVNIGNNVVVAARSLVNKNLPDGCLAGGSPVKVIKKNTYPKILTAEEIALKLKDILSCLHIDCDAINITTYSKEVCISFDKVLFDVTNHTIIGSVSHNTESVKNQLRRNGIRFKYTDREGVYTPWNEC